MSDSLPYFVSSEDAVELPWSRTNVPARRRAAPDGLVLFDLLLQLAQIDPVLYPPQDHLSLRRLLSAIDDSATFDTLKKNCLVYYLLREYEDGREADYAHKRRIPKRFVTSTDAYWLLDHGDYVLGAKKLCAPGVVPDFMPTILRLLSSSDDQTESSQLIVNIVSYKAPDLSDISDAKIVLAAFLRTGRVAEAMDLGRKVALAPVQTQDVIEEEAARQAVQTLSDLVSFTFDTCFTSLPPLSTALDKLLYTPLSQEEDAAMMKWLSDALASSSKLPDANISLLTEWATGRLMAQGRFVDAITLLSRSSTSLRRSAQAQKRVQDILADLYSVLPPIQRSLVDVTLATSGKDDRKQPEASTSTAPASITQMPWLGGVNMANLPAPRSLVQAKANKAFLDEMKTGGKPLNREVDLPLSAGGLLRPTLQNNIGVSRSQGRHDERMDVWSAVKRTDSPAKPRHAPASAYSSAAPASPAGAGTPGRYTGSPFAGLSSTAAQSSRKPTVQGFGLHRPSANGARQSVTQLDFSEAMKKYSNRHTQADVSAGALREQPKAYDMPAKIQRKHLPPGAFPTSASVAGTNYTNTDDEDGNGSDGGMSDISEIPIPGSVRRNPQVPEGVAVTDFAAPPARSTRSRRQSSLVPQAPEASTSAPTTGRKTRQRTTSTRDMAASTPAKKGKTVSASASRNDTAPRRSKRLGSVAPSEPELQMMDVPDADDSIMVENSMIGRGTTRGGTGRTPRRRRP